MHTLARYFVALLLFLITYFSNDDAPKEQLTTNSTTEQLQSSEANVCKQYKEVRNIS